MQNSVIPCFVTFRYFLLSEGHIHNLLHLLNLLSVNHADDCVHAPLCDFRHILTDRRRPCRERSKIQTVVADHLQFFRNLDSFLQHLHAHCRCDIGCKKSSIPSKWLMYFFQIVGPLWKLGSCSATNRCNFTFMLFANFRKPSVTIHRVTTLLLHSTQNHSRSYIRRSKVPAPQSSPPRLWSECIHGIPSVT